MDIVVSGSHGFIGSALVPALEAAGHRARRLVRGAAGDGEVAWDPDAGTIDAAALGGVEGVVHLAGVGIGDKRWTPEQKERIRGSRVQGTGVLAKALASLPTPPRVLVSGSAVGYYGDRGDEILTEESSPGDGFLAEVVRAWEDATVPAADAGIRVVKLRSGIVQDPSGGALRKQLPMFKIGVGGPLGNGRQWVSWITLEDEIAAILHLLGDDTLAGPVNVTAPEPVTSAGLAHALGKAVHRPAVLPVPKAALGLVVGRQMADEMITASQRAMPARLLAAGFTFRHPEVGPAMAALLQR
ncbi:MAG: TIGR01777 family oxidoreductase [Acidimicrobiales bacterium]